jgi:hypothetical protein
VVKEIAQKLKIFGLRKLNLDHEKIKVLNLILTDSFNGEL